MIGRTIADAAEAIPGEKLDFTPEALHIQGSASTGVRTFAEQVKRLATDNSTIWSSLTGDRMPPGIRNVNGPEVLTAKREIVKFLKDCL